MRTIYYLIIILFFVASGCNNGNVQSPDPSLELGQKIVFLGSAPDKTYVIIGYKEDYNSPVEKEWKNQDYIVFLYINNFNDVKEATIHKNSIIKQ